METDDRIYRIRIYFGESDHYRSQPLYMVLLEYLRKHGAMGATVIRGLAGFGAHSRIHTASVLSLSADLPIVVEWVDVAARVDALLPEIQALVQGRMITREEVELLQVIQG